MKMPYKVEIEYQVIATLVSEPDLISRYPVKEDHFYHHNNLLAFKVLKRMVEVGEKINLVSFGSRFYDCGGKVSEITALFSQGDWYSPLFLDTYVKQLAEETAKRKIIDRYGKLGSAPKQFIEEMKKIELDFIENKPLSISEVFKKYRETYNDERQQIKDHGGTGVITGFKKIDENASFDAGNLIILAARTSVGKTALSLNIGINSAMFGQKVMFFSAEMTVEQLAHRVYAQLSDVSSTKFKYRDAAHAMDRLEGEIAACSDNLLLVDTSNATSAEVCRLVRQQAALGDVDLVVVDYIQYLKDPVEKGATNNDRIGMITRNLKGLALELKCCVLALSQVNRSTSGMPELHNLRDSGNIEQDSDIVLILDRQNKDSEIAELLIAKNRNGQASLAFDLHFNPKLTKFYEKRS